MCPDCSCTRQPFEHTSLPFLSGHSPGGPSSPADRIGNSGSICYVLVHSQVQKGGGRSCRCTCCCPCKLPPKEDSTEPPLLYFRLRGAVDEDMTLGAWWGGGARGKRAQGQAHSCKGVHMTQAADRADRKGMPWQREGWWRGGGHGTHLREDC